MKLSEHFTVEEMQCPTTGELKLEGDFLEQLEILRVEYGAPMVVTSGCRTIEHNDKLIAKGYPASKGSLHMIDNKKYNTDTCAVDIAKPNIFDQARLISLALRAGWTVRCGRTFIHLDLRTIYTALSQHFDLY